MDSFEKEINTTLLKLNIPFVDYGTTSSDSISLEGIFRNPGFPNLSQNRNQLFRMASMTKPITAYLALAVLEDNGIDLHDNVGKYVPEIDDLEIAYKEGNVIKYQKNNVPISFHHLLSCTSGHAYNITIQCIGVGIKKRTCPNEKRG